MRTSTLQLIARARRSAWTLPVAALAAVLLVGINEATYERASASLQGLEDRTQPRRELRQVLRALIESESAQRGHLLTGRDEYLQHYRRSVETVHTSLAWLQRHYAADTAAMPLMAAIHSFSLAGLSVLDTTLLMYSRSRSDAWRELMLSDIGREKMEGLRSAAQALMALETQRVEHERARVLSAVQGGRLGIHAMTALGLLALFVFVRQTLAFDRARREHAAALQGERDWLEAEVTRRSAELAELARHLQTAREDERALLARELHDELGALLIAAKLDVARLKRMLGTPPSDIDGRLRHLNDAINRGVELKRRIIEDLRPSSLDTLGLAAALDILAREQGARHGTHLHSELVELQLAGNAQIVAYRLVQEALKNAARYASPSEISILLQPQQRVGRAGALVAVQDDGCGFDTRQRGGYTRGLMALRYRVEGEGGEMNVRSAPGQGTQVEAWFPLPTAAPLPAVPAAPAAPAAVPTPPHPAPSPGFPNASAAVG